MFAAWSSSLRRFSPRPFKVAAASWLLILGSSALAAADKAAEPIRLAYEASEGCPDQAAFVARILARTNRVRPAWPGERARSFGVTASAGPPPSGQVTIRDEQGSETSRSLHGDTCSDVVDGMALVVALAVDPRAGMPVDAAGGAAATPSEPTGTGVSALDPPASASAANAPAPKASSVDPVASSASSAPSSSAVSLEAGVGQPVAVQDQPVSSPAKAPASASSPEENGSIRASAVGRSFFVGGDFAVVTGVVSAALLAGSPYVGWRANRASWLDPSVRLAFVRATSGAVDVADGASASFTWTVGRLDLCPLASPEWAVRARVCARAEAGTLEGHGANIPGASSRLTPWFAAGAILRLEWALPWRIFVDAEVGALVRATDHRFVFDSPTGLSDIQIDQVPLLGATAGTGLGVDFM